MGRRHRDSKQDGALTYKAKAPPAKARRSDMSCSRSADRRHRGRQRARFATREEAEANVANLMQRWLTVTDTRVVESADPVNYRWTDEGLAADSTRRP